ncbi:MAG: hypothetical protein IJ877_02745 [Candidatus Gastranaerophilales bacterium]|nr:hypothetical protein [Candidatus Gastranaerophilales bacterium]
MLVNEVKPIQDVNLVTIKLLQTLEMEENVLLKELLAKHKGENPVVIDFEAPDEFANQKRYQMLTSSHLWVNLEDNVERELNLTFKDKLDVEVTHLG